MKHSRTLRLPALAVTIALTGLAVAACGSSSNTGSNSTTTSGSAATAASGGTSSAARSKFVACLKAHGVTLPARPAGGRRRPPGGYGGGGPGFFFGGGGAGRSGPPPGAAGGGASRFNNPKFRAAFQACGGGQFRRRNFTPAKAAVTRFVACVKEHGYALPKPNFSGKGSIFPRSIEANKKFQAAAKACASDLRPQAGSAPGGAAPGGGSTSD